MLTKFCSCLMYKMLLSIRVCTFVGKPTKNAIGMYSKDGDEYVPFHKPFPCEGPVEDWLNGVVDMMRDTLKCVFK